MTVEWKIKDRVVETESIDPGHTSVSLISINAASGDIFQVGADSTGSSHLGTWKFQKTGDAVLNLDFTTAANHWAQIITTGEVPDIGPDFTTNGFRSVACSLDSPNSTRKQPSTSSLADGTGVTCLTCS
jgi:hypothetical protein